jgi:DNA-binding transcriptional LysR family regulator
VKLFAREGRQVALTPAGETFRDGLRDTLRTLEDTTRRTRAAGGLDDTRLSIGLVEYAAVPMLPAAVKRLQALYPEVRLSRHEMNAAAQIDALLRGQVDVGIAVVVDDPARLLPPGGAVRTQPLLAACWKLLVPDTHPLADVPSIDLPRLAREPIVMFAREVNPAVYDWVLASCRQAGAPLDIVYETSQAQNGVRLAREGVGGMFGSGFVFGDDLPGMVAVPVPGLAPLAMHAFWRAREPRPLVLDFVEITVEEARRHEVTRLKPVR